MELIEDLGLRPYGSQGKKVRFGIYKCPVCGKHFEAATANVVAGKSTKCRTCSSRATSIIGTETNRLKAMSTFIQRATEIHKGIYLYDEFVYVDRATKGTVKCRKHGRFEQTPNSHLSGQGCPECARENNGKHTVSNTEEFIAKALLKHGDICKYSKVDYINSYTKIIVTCLIHDDFLQTPNRHLSNPIPCPMCARELAIMHNVNRLHTETNIPTTLYYVWIPERNLWKIGCTSKSVPIRFKEDKLRIDILFEKVYDSSIVAYNIEKYLLSNTFCNKYRGPKVLQNGNSELRVQPIENFESLLQEAEVHVKEQL